METDHLKPLVSGIDDFFSDPLLDLFVRSAAGLTDRHMLPALHQWFTSINLAARHAFAPRH
jgi:hypothetical protein